MKNIIVNGKYLVETQYLGSGFHNYLKAIIQAWTKKCNNQYHILLPENGSSASEIANRLIPYSSTSVKVFFHTLPQRSRFFENDLVTPEVIDRYQAQYIFFPHLELPRLSHPLPYSVVIHDLIPTLFLSPSYLLKGKTSLKMITRKGITDYLLLKRHLPQIHHVIAISETTRQSLLTLFGNQIAHKVQVIPPAINDGFAIDKPPAESSQILKRFALGSKQFAIYFGGYTVRKNYHRLIKGFTQAIALYRKRKAVEERTHFPLVMVGGEGKVKKFPTVITTPKLPEEELRILIREAAFSIYPSLFEGFGLPILESLSLGTLPLLSDIPSSREIIPDPPPHLFFHPYQSESIARSIHHYLIHPQAIASDYVIIKDRIKKFTENNPGEKVDKLFI